MKKIFHYIILAGVVASSALTTSCSREEDDIFDKSAAERLNEVSTIYGQRLTASKGGWLMEYYPTTDTDQYDGGEAASVMGFPIITQFKTDGSVLVAMNNPFTNITTDTEDSRAYGAAKYAEQSSLWEIITDNGPVLTFNTYNKLFHAFSDPRTYSVSDMGWGNSSKGSQGVAVGGDYEFVMISVPEDGGQVMLKGKKRGTYCRLTPLPEGTDFNAYLTDLKHFQDSVFAKAAPNYFVLTVDGDKYKTNDIFSTIVNIYPYDGDEIANETYHPYLITKRDGKYYMRFRDKFQYEDSQNDSIKKYELQELVFDPAQSCFYEEGKPENTLKPQTPQSLFVDVMKANGWLLSRKKGTGALNDAYEAAYNAFRGVKYTLTNMALVKQDADTYALRVKYNTGKSVANVLYTFTVEEADGSLKLAYKEPASTAAANILAKLPAVQQMLDALTGTFSVSPKNSPFNLSTVVITNAADAGSSYTVSAQ